MCARGPAPSRLCSSGCQRPVPSARDPLADTPRIVLDQISRHLLSVPVKLAHETSCHVVTPCQLGTRHAAWCLISRQRQGQGHSPAQQADTVRPTTRTHQALLRRRWGHPSVACTKRHREAAAVSQAYFFGPARAAVVSRRLAGRDHSPQPAQQPPLLCLLIQLSDSHLNLRVMPALATGPLGDDGVAGKLTVAHRAGHPIPLSVTTPLF